MFSIVFIRSLRSRARSMTELIISDVFALILGQNSSGQMKYLLPLSFRKAGRLWCGGAR